MREPYERIAGGPFRDDTHRAAVEATAADLAGRPRPTDRELVEALGRTVCNRRRMATDAVLAVDGRATRVEAEDGRVRASQAELPEVEITPEGIHIPVSLAWQGAAWDLGCIYDAATRALATAGPLLLDSNEPWVESDEAYAKRIGNTGKASGHELDDLGDWRRPKVVRARLVPTDAAMRDVNEDM